MTADASHALRPYQAAALAAVRAHWAAGRRRVCCVAPTGAGKTTLAAAALAGARAPLALVHTRTLRDQSQHRLGAGVRVMTIQAALRLPAGALAHHDVVFIDECFTRDTVIQAVGDVVAVSSKPAPDTLIEIDGVVSTPDHPYLTTEGWKRAEDVRAGDLCCVRKTDPASQEEDPQNVLPRVSLEAVERDHELHQQASRECKADRRGQHDSPTGRAREAERNLAGQETPASGAVRERPWVHVAGVDAGTRNGVAVSGSDDGRRAAPISLQVGPCLRISEVGGGDRREHTSEPTGAVQRRAQDEALGWARVGSVAVHQRGGVGRYAEVCPDGLVYNIQTTAGVYFAGGRLVHNCHHLGSRAWVRVLALLSPTALVLGCTATPARADGTALGRGGAGFDALVATASYTNLLRAGHLAPARVVPAARFRGNPAAAYLALGGGRPGIVFAPTMKACNAAVMALGVAGVRAAAITAKTPAAMRTWAFAAFERGDLDVLVSPMALSEGFDSPRAAVCVLDRSCEHVGTYLQMAGRVLRPHPTKGAASPALVLDLRGAAARHGSPTDDRTYSLEGTPIDRVVSAPTAARKRGQAGFAAPIAPAAAIGRGVGVALRGAWQWVRTALAA